MADDTWNEMKQAQRTQTVFTVTNTPVLIVPVSDNRVAVVINGDGTQDLYLSFDPSPSAANGMHLPTGSAPLHLSLTHHGRMVRGPIYAASPGGSQKVTVWDAIHPCPCLA